MSKDVQKPTFKQIEGLQKPVYTNAPLLHINL